MADSQTFSNETVSMMLSDENDQRVLKDLLTGKRVEDKKAAERVATAFVERAIAGIEVNSIYTGTESDVVTKALMFSGMNDKGQSVVPDSLGDDAFKKLLPVAMGETEDSRLFNTHVNEAFVGFLKDPESTGFHQNAQKNIKEFVTNERAEVVLERVRQGHLDVPYEASELNDIAERQGVDLRFDEQPEPSIDDENTPQEKNELSDDNMAKLGTESTSPDAGEVAAREEAAAQRYQLEVEARTDSLMKLNKLMESQPDWVNRSVVDKIKTKASDLSDKALGKSAFVYPNESIFSETLSQVDESGRVVQEMVRYQNNPLTGFKAKFNSPKMPEEAYLATALRLRAEGIKHPYVKTSFRNPQDGKLFMEKTVDALVSAGYDIEDIRVSPNLTPYFEDMKANKYPEYSLGEAPEEMVANPDDPAVQQANSEELTPGEKVRQDNAEERLKNNPELAEAEALAQQLREINEPVARIRDGLNDEESPMKMSDFKSEDLLPVLARVPLLETSQDSWNEALKSGGLTPSMRETVEGVKDTYMGYLKKAGSDPGELGKNEMSKLLDAKEELFRVMPESYHERLGSVFAGVDDFVRKSNLEQNQPVEDNLDNEPSPQSPDSTTLDEQQSSDYEPSEPAHQADNDTPLPRSEEPGEIDPASQPEPPRNTEEPPPIGDDELPHVDREDDELDPIDLGFDVDERNEQLNSPVAEHVNAEPESDAPDDVEPQIFSINKESWGGLVGADIEKIPHDFLHKIAALSPKEILQLNHSQPADGWDADEYNEVVNTIDTAHMVMNPYNIQVESFGERERELLKHLPDELVPDALTEEREKLLKMDSKPLPENQEINRPSVRRN